MKMHSIGIMLGVFCLVIAVMGYFVVEIGVMWVPSENGEITDRFGVRYDEHIIVRRPFEQPSQVLGTFGVLVLAAGILFSTRHVQESPV